MPDTDPHRLDTTGTLCPVPILLTARAVGDLAPGDLLEVTGDDPGIQEDMPAWCAETGHELLSMSEEGGRVVCLLRVGSGLPPGG